MSPIAAVLFMTGIMSTIVGAARSIASARSGLAWLDGDTAARTADRRPGRPHVASVLGRTTIRRAVPAVVWLAVAVYGLILASAGIVIAR